MKTKKIIVKIQETSTRTIEFDCELEIPVEILNSENEDDINDFINENLSNSKKYNFVDIVESELLDTEIINFKQGELPLNVNSSYTIQL